MPFSKPSKVLEEGKWPPSLLSYFFFLFHESVNARVKDSLSYINGRGSLGRREKESVNVLTIVERTKPWPSQTFDGCLEATGRNRKYII